MIYIVSSAESMLNMKGFQNDEKKISDIMRNLNWWVEQTYNSETDEIESTGEAQAAINNYLETLDKMNVNYSFEGGKYHLQKR